MFIKNMKYSFITIYIIYKFTFIYLFILFIITFTKLTYMTYESGQMLISSLRGAGDHVLRT